MAYDRVPWATKELITSVKLNQMLDNVLASRDAAIMRPVIASVYCLGKFDNSVDLDDMEFRFTLTIDGQQVAQDTFSASESTQHFVSNNYVIPTAVSAGRVTVTLTWEWQDTSSPGWSAFTYVDNDTAYSRIQHDGFVTGQRSTIWIADDDDKYVTISFYHTSAKKTATDYLEFVQVKGLQVTSYRESL